MYILLILCYIILLVVLQVSVLAFLPIFGIVINIILLITLALNINRWDELAPLWVGVGGLLLDLFSTEHFGLYTISLSLTYLLLWWISRKISILIERQYLVAIWVFIGILSFQFSNLVLLYFWGEISNPANYWLILLKALIIHMLLYIPIDYFVRTLYKKKLNQSQINL